MRVRLELRGNIVIPFPMQQKISPYGSINCDRGFSAMNDPFQDGADRDHLNAERSITGRDGLRQVIKMASFGPIGSLGALGGQARASRSA